jgi:hypothetical protein
MSVGLHGVYCWVDANVTFLCGVFRDGIRVQGVLYVGSKIEELKSSSENLPRKGRKGYSKSDVMKMKGLLLARHFP